MKTESSFRVFRGKYVFGLAQPIVIVTRDVETAGSAFSESHILFCDRPEIESYRIATTIDFGQFPPGIFSLDLLVDESLERAQAWILRYFHEKVPQQEQRHIFDGPYEFTEIEQSAIVGLWIRGRFVSQIRKLQAKCGSTRLSEFLDTVVQLPILEFKEE